MDKCEWKDGLLTCCRDLHREITRSFQSAEEWDKMYRRGLLTDCPHCGVSLKDPDLEPQVTIKKSGGTWVKREGGIDYLCINPHNYDYGFKDPSNWKPFSEIEVNN
jgi:hypothetical protein